MRISQVEVRAIFTYEPYTGILYKTARASKTPIRAKYIWVNNTQYTTASIIWIYMKGEHNPYVKRHDKDYTNNQWYNFS